MHRACTFQFAAVHESRVQSRVQSRHVLAVDFFVRVPPLYAEWGGFIPIVQVAKALASEKQIRFAPFADGRLTEVRAGVGSRPVL